MKSTEMRFSVTISKKLHERFCKITPWGTRNAVVTALIQLMVDQVEQAPATADGVIVTSQKIQRIINAADGQHGDVADIEC